MTVSILTVVDTTIDRDYAAARRNFESVWAPNRRRFTAPGAAEPTVEELLGVDRQFRAFVRAHRHKDSPVAPVRIQRDHRQYVAQFGLPRQRNRLDCVLLTLDGATPSGLYTVITGARNSLAGKRVIRGREPECLAYYRNIGQAR